MLGAIEGNITENVVVRKIYSPSTGCRAGSYGWDRHKHKAGVLHFWRHLKLKRNCFLFQRNGNWESGTKFNIFRNTGYHTLKPWDAFSFFLKKRDSTAGGAGKEWEGSWGAQMFWRGISQRSEVIYTKLFSIKIQIRKLGVGISGSGLYCGQPHSIRDIPPLFYLFYGKWIKDPQ